MLGTKQAPVFDEELFHFGKAVHVREFVEKTNEVVVYDALIQETKPSELIVVSLTPTGLNKGKVFFRVIPIDRYLDATFLVLSLKKEDPHGNADQQ